MSDKIHWTEEHLDARLNVAHYSGEHAGVERAIKQMLSWAGQAFADGDDRAASQFRNAAERLKREALAPLARQIEDLRKELAEAEAEAEDKASS